MPSSATAGRVFISYRRADSAATAGRLYDRLEARFGPDRVFMDVRSITPGRDFAESIEIAIGSCAVVLAVIGPGWRGATDDRGRPRLDDPDDLVAIEVRAGLDRDIAVIPVLVGGAAQPRAAELPPSLVRLAGRQSVRLDHDSFDGDAAALVRVLERAFATSTAGAEEPGPEDVQALIRRGLASKERGRPGAALRDLDEAVLLDPDNAYALACRGAVRLDLRRYGDALRDLDRALHLDPGDVDALANRGAAKKNLGRFTDALRDLDRVVDVQPHNTYALGCRAATYLDLRRHDDALRDLDQALRLDPDHGYALGLRGAVHLHSGRYDDAALDLDRCLRLDPDSGYFRDLRRQVEQARERRDTGDRDG